MIFRISKHYFYVKIGSVQNPLPDNLVFGGRSSAYFSCAMIQIIQTGYDDDPASKVRCFGTYV